MALLVYKEEVIGIKQNIWYRGENIISVAICDDSKAIVEAMKASLEEYAKERDVYCTDYFRRGKCSQSFYLQMAGRKGKAAPA